MSTDLSSKLAQIIEQIPKDVLYDFLWLGEDVTMENTELRDAKADVIFVLVPVLGRMLTLMKL